MLARIYSTQSGDGRQVMCRLYAAGPQVIKPFGERRSGRLLQTLPVHGAAISRRSLIGCDRASRVLNSGSLDFRASERLNDHGGTARGIEIKAAVEEDRDAVRGAVAEAPDIHFDQLDAAVGAFSHGMGVRVSCRQGVR